MEKEIEEHLNGFPERQKDILRFRKTIIKDISELKKIVQDGIEHQEPASRTIVMIGDLKDTIDDHILKYDLLEKGNSVWKKKTDDAIHQLDELMPIVREKLLPAYEKEARRDMAISWFIEKAKTSRFWFGWLASLGVIVAGFIYILKQFLKS